VSQFGEWVLTGGDAIGDGSFGKIFEVVRNAPGTNVRQYGALKLVGDPSNSQMRESIENEIDSYASLQSPFIPTFFEAGWDETYGPWFIVALIKGKNLRELIDSGHLLTRDEWYNLADDILSALITVHGHNLTHLDIWKPNLMKIDSGQWLLIDFGLTVKEFAKPLASNWGWGAPEQYREGTLPTAAADIFALGNALYCALTGKNPYDSYAPIPYFQAVQEFAPNLNDVDADIREFLAPMFAIKPEQRATAVQLKKNLKVLMGLESAPDIENQQIVAWAQLNSLVADELNRSTDFRLTLSQAPSINANIDILLEDAGYRVGFNSEKTLGKVLSSSGRLKLAQLGFAIDPSGNYYTRQPKQAEELPTLIEVLSKSGLELSLAELFYELS
jgi:serine/threonine protein kinase